jgi:hypothetical protein
MVDKKCEYRNPREFNFINPNILWKVVMVVRETLYIARPRVFIVKGGKNPARAARAPNPCPFIFRAGAYPDFLGVG